MKESLTKREKEFCTYYVTLRNAREAATLAGYSVLARAAGDKLLLKKAVRDEIKRISDLKKQLESAKAGFERIAFGSIADAIRLIDGDRDNLDAMDLFMVSDIKIPKGGGMEIKFFDRQKALESLAALEEISANDASLPIYKALESSARAITAKSEAYTDEE